MRLFLWHQNVTFRLFAYEQMAHRLLSIYPRKRIFQSTGRVKKIIVENCQPKMKKYCPRYRCLIIIFFSWLLSHSIALSFSLSVFRMHADGECSCAAASCNRAAARLPFQFCLRVEQMRNFRKANFFFFINFVLCFSQSNTNRP